MTSQFDVIVNRVNGKLEKTVRGTIIEIGKRLIDKSPVGDSSYWKSKYKPEGYVGGAFRANWQYGFNSQPSGEVAGADKAGTVTKEKIKSGVNASPAFGIHYIVNNLPYSIRLENGWSRQAPHGMLKLTAMEFGSIVTQSNANKK